MRTICDWRFALQKLTSSRYSNHIKSSTCSNPGLSIKRPQKDSGRHRCGSGFVPVDKPNKTLNYCVRQAHTHTQHCRQFLIFHPRLENKKEHHRWQPPGRVWSGVRTWNATVREPNPRRLYINYRLSHAGNKRNATCNLSNAEILSSRNSIGNGNYSVHVYLRT